MLSKYMRMCLSSLSRKRQFVKILLKKGKVGSKGSRELAMLLMSVLGNSSVVV